MRFILPAIYASVFAVAIYFALSPTMSDAGARARIGAPLFLATLAPAIGFYDGIFGPGAGSFYMIGFVALLGHGVLRATAHTKLANFASNAGGLAAFAFGGLIVWKVGLVMAAAQFAGGRIGAGLALKNGARLIKPLLILVSLAMALRLGLAPGHPIGAWLRGMVGL